MLMHWGRGLFIGGVIGALLAAAPAMLLTLFPALSDGMINAVAVLLVLSVLPMMGLSAAVGAVLLGLALLRRWRA